MLKVYDKETDIPEALKAEYIQQGSKWVPHLSDDHPAIVFNKTLKQEKEVEEARVKKLRGDLDDALAAGKDSGLPRGHVAVSKADAELLDKAKALGSIDEVTAKLGEYDTLKAEQAKRSTEDKRRQVAKALGYDNTEAFVRLPNLPDFEIRGEGDKQTVVALVKDGDKTIEKPAGEFMASSPDHAPFLSALKSQPEGVTFPDSGGQGPTPAPDALTRAKQWAENYNKQHQPTSSLAERFGLAKSA